MILEWSYSDHANKVSLQVAPIELYVKKQNKNTQHICSQQTIYHNNNNTVDL